MRNLPRDLRTFLLSQATITKLVGNNVYHGSVPQGTETTYIWLSRSGSENLECLDDAAGQEPFKQFIDLECISPDLGKAETIAGAVHDLFPRGGTLGSGTIQRAYCNSQDDSYVSRNTAKAEFTHFCAMSLEIYP